MQARATIAHYPAQRKSAGRANSRLTWYVVEQRASCWKTNNTNMSNTTIQYVLLKGNPKEGAQVISHMKIYEYVYVYVYWYV